jgi:hypothetical protein
MHLKITADVFVSCLEALRLSFMNVNSISKGGLVIQYKQFLYNLCDLADTEMIVSKTS